MRKPDSLSRDSGDEKSAMDAKYSEEGQLLDLEQDENDNERNTDDIELEEIDVSKSDKCIGLRLFPEEHRLEVLRPHYDC